MYYEKPMSGVLRISNPKTLEKWIHNKSYQKELNDGYIFNPDCGRFRNIQCTCYKCRKLNGTITGNKLRLIIKRHYKDENRN
tara:strand:+ start:104 stop:349 length:246 start_codon:yes stop_codon:yes gene_type:complete